MRTAAMTRKTIPVYSLLGVLLVFVWWLSACSKENKVVEVTNVTINEPSLTLKVGESKPLTATITPADATDKTVTWSSENEAGCTVDPTGMVKAIAVGTTTIKAKAGDKEASIPVTVTATGLPAPVVITWEPAGDTYSAQVGSASFTKKATFSNVPGCNAVVTYSIKPESGVASIDAKTGEVTPAKSITGSTVTATVSATTSAVAGVCVSATASYTLTVTTFPVISWKTEPPNDVWAKEDDIAIAATVSGGSTPTYEALDPTTGKASTMASITGDANGYKLHLTAEAKRGGSVKIRVKSSNTPNPLEKTVFIKDWVASDLVAANANYAESRQLLIGKDNNIYSTTNNYKILKVESDGKVTTYAGTDTQGSSDGTSKDNATFYSLKGMAMDKDGNIYVADLYSFRKISANGTVKTIKSAAYGQPISKLQFDTNGILYGTAASGIVKFDLETGNSAQYAGGTSEGYVDGSLNNARFKAAIGLTFVSGNMYTCDSGNGLIRKIDMTAGVVSTFSGAPQSGDFYSFKSTDGPADKATFGNLQDITADTSGHLFVIESAYNSGTNSYSGALRRIDAAGNVKTIVSDGIGNAQSIVRDASGNLYVGVGNSTSGYKLIKFVYQ